MRQPNHYKEPSEEKQLEQIQRRKYHTKKANLQRRGEDFPVTFAEISWPVRCPILRIEIDYLSESRKDSSPSFQRHNRAEGWTRENTFICSWRASQLIKFSIDELYKALDFLE